MYLPNNRSSYFDRNFGRLIYRFNYYSVVMDIICKKIYEIHFIIYNLNFSLISFSKIYFFFIEY